jgi:hypothetical protein
MRQGLHPTNSLPSSANRRQPRCWGNMAMILKFVTKNGTKVYGPPYTKQEEADFYRHNANGPVTIARDRADVRIELMSTDDEYRRVAEIERAANGKPSYLDMVVLCPNAGGHNGGTRKRADWCHDHAWNSKPYVRLAPNLEVSSASATGDQALTHP